MSSCIVYWNNLYVKDEKQKQKKLIIIIIIIIMEKWKWNLKQTKTTIATTKIIFFDRRINNYFLNTEKNTNTHTHNRSKMQFKRLCLKHCEQIKSTT